MPNFTDKSEPDSRRGRPLSEGGFPWWKAAAFIPLALALGGWFVTHEARVDALEKSVQHDKETLRLLEQAANDPRPKPEARVLFENNRREIDEIRRQHERIEERLNNLHMFMRKSEEWRPRPNEKRGFLDPPTDSPLIR